MRALLLLPCLLVTSCALFKKGTGESAAKPGVIIYQAPKEYQTKENMYLPDGTPAKPAQAAADNSLPAMGPAPMKPVPTADTTGFRTPDITSKLPEDKEFRGSSAAQKAGNNQGVIAKPPTSNE
ncbi:hypothetical protein [Luteolibacter sp. LG18]|uniref:hypothetical protein n=1 Tax=Luteolibacter sp. LG18 TaxID=2819286 RepID=UPI0030C6E10D